MKNFFSFFFTLILLFPPVFNLVHHLVEEHKHCDVSEVHLHQLENKCEFCALLNTNSAEEELFNFSKDLILFDLNFLSSDRFGRAKQMEPSQIGSQRPAKGASAWERG